MTPDQINQIVLMCVLVAAALVWGFGLGAWVQRKTLWKIAANNLKPRMLEKIFGKQPKDQTTWLHCPRCHAELVTGGNIIDVDDNTGIYVYHCANCGEPSRWQFGAFPVPVLLEHGMISNRAPPMETT